MPRKPPVHSEAAPVAPPDTRRRILELAWERVAIERDASLSLVALAQLAGVSRQTLYLQFGSRAGLLLAMVAHHDEQWDIGGRLAKARGALPPRDAIKPYLAVWLDYLPRVFPVARALLAAIEHGDVEARQAWQSRMQLLRQGYLQMTRALDACGDLRPGWTAASAADWMFTMTHVDNWQHLVIDAGWKPRDAAERIVNTLHDTLVKPLRRGDSAMTDQAHPIKPG